MSLLTDSQLRSNLWALGLESVKDEQIQPASIDLTLGDEFLYPTIDDDWIPAILGESDTYPKTKLFKTSRFCLYPGEFVLGTTEETIRVPRDLVGQIEGKSSLGRLGLLIHATAGFIDPGFIGKITLEMYNLNKVPIVLVPGRYICQVSFVQLNGQVLRPYGHPDLHSKYQDQDQVTEAR